MVMFVVNAWQTTVDAIVHIFLKLDLFYNTRPAPSVMASVKPRNAQFLYGYPLILSKRYISFNSIHRGAIQSRRLPSRSRVTVPCSNGPGRSYSTVPPSDPIPARSGLVGKTGRQYSIGCVLQEKDSRPEGCIVCILYNPNNNYCNFRPEQHWRSAVERCCRIGRAETIIKDA